MRFAVALTAVLLALSGTAQAAGPPLGPDGETAAVYDYTQAVRERAFITQPGVDQDRNGVDDKVTVDVIRPNGAGPFPAIVDASPYYTSVCRGLRSECMGDKDGDGVNDLWPLFADNYFVPRGYAVVLAQMNGTGYTNDSCPAHGGPSDIAGMKSVIQWISGQPWSNGASAMIGKSYDGTLANGVAATGVQGLKTIVPISAISDWYGYSREGGIRTTITNYPSSLNNSIMTPKAGTGALDRRTVCAPANTDFNAADGDETGDRNAFWEDRNYVKDVGKVKAAVFATHGFQDDNVKLSQLWPWWNGLKNDGVPVKLWLLRSGHTDPFDSRRAEWVDTLHRWFDHFLYGVDNGILNEPRVTIEDGKDVWHDYADWPIPGTSDVDVFLRDTDPATAGRLRGAAGADGDTVSFTGNGTGAGLTISSALETTYMTQPTDSQANRRVFLSPPLARDVRLSGRAVLDLRASLTTTQSNLGVILVDYSAAPFEEVSRTNDGLTASGPATDCWGTSGTYDSACFTGVNKPVQSVTQWRVTRGILDSSNRNSLTTPENALSGQAHDFTIPTAPTEHTFAAGHQIGVVVVGNLYGIAGTPGAGITVDTKVSRMVLPILGGDAAARAAGLTDEAAPTTAAALSEPVNGAGWVHAKPTVLLTTNDGDGSGAASITYSLGGDPPITVDADHASVPVDDEGVTTIHYSATDRAGNAEADHELMVRVDTTAPAVACPPDTTWHRDNVTIACTVTDAGSGVAGDTAFTLRTAVPNGIEDAHATASRTVCDVAGSCTAARPVRRIDRRAPAITLTAPAVTVFARGAVVAIGHRCADAGSGVAICSGPSALDTAAAGPHTLTFTARDAVGNARTQTWSYSVLGSLPQLGIARRGGLKLALTSPVAAVVKVTGTVKLHGKRGKVRTLRVNLAPGQTRVAGLKVPKRFKKARGLDLKLVTTAGALTRSDRFRR